MKYTIKLDEEELEAALFAVKTDLEVTMTDPQEWTVGELLALQTLLKKLEGAKNERTNKLSNNGA